MVPGLTGCCRPGVRSKARRTARSVVGSWLLQAALGAALVGCAGPYQAYPVVPPPRDEAVPRPPRSPVALSWRPGHYDYHDGLYDWVVGQWVPASGHGLLWQDGYWVRSGVTSYEWVRAGWK